MVHPQRRPRRPTCAATLARARRASSTGTPTTCGTATRTGSRASTATGWSAASASSACPFPVWYRLDADGEPDYDRPDRARRGRRCPIDPPAARPRRASTEAQRGQPGGFIGDPDIMDTWATSSLTPQIACGWERRPRPVRPHLPDGPAAAGPRHHPHLAVLDRRAHPLRARHRAVGATPRCRAGSSTPTARRCRSRRATSSRPSTLLEQYGTDAVRYWAASGRPGTDTAFDERPDEDRAPARRSSCSTPRSFALGLGAADPTRRLDHRAARPRHARRLAALVDEATTAFDGYDYARALERTEDVLLVASATTTSSWSRAGPTAATVAEAAPRPPGRPCAVALVDAAAAVRAVPALRHRGGLVVVADGLGRTGRRGPRRADSARSRGARRRRPAGPRPSPSTSSAASPPRQVRRQAVDARRRRARHRARHHGPPRRAGLGRGRRASPPATWPSSRPSSRHRRRRARCRGAPHAPRHRRRAHGLTGRGRT